MAKDDYFVLVYQILDYLYQCLKKGETVKEKILSPRSLYCINESYWNYIFKHLVASGYVEGVKLVTRINGKIEVLSVADIQITPKGIAYLLYDELMQKEKAS